MTTKREPLATTFSTTVSAPTAHGQAIQGTMTRGSPLKTASILTSPSLETRM
jgi:hypothetical protein